MTLRSCGLVAVLAELDDLDAVLAADAVVRPRVDTGDGPWGQVVDLIPAARTLLVTVGDPAALPGVRSALHHLISETEPVVREASADVIDIPVEYDGPDLADIAELTGLSEREVVAAHTGTPWRVAFGGFAPGFAYLSGGDERLQVPRRASPRTQVPAGAVGIAGGFSGIYPRPSPGGWQLLGHSDVALWDADRDPPALLRPGWSVRFVAAS